MCALGRGAMGGATTAVGPEEVPWGMLLLLWAPGPQGEAYPRAGGLDAKAHPAMGGLVRLLLLAAIVAAIPLAPLHLSLPPL